jgi:hypothetical protein
MRQGMVMKDNEAIGSGGSLQDSAYVLDNAGEQAPARFANGRGSSH